MGVRDLALRRPHRASETEVTFAVYAPAATRVELELYAEAVGKDAFAGFLLTRCTDGIWRGKFEHLGAGRAVRVPLLGCELAVRSRRGPAAAPRPGS